MTTKRKQTEWHKWAMPKWMDKYKGCINNTGGNSIEELVNGRTCVGVNMPLAILEMCVQSQVTFLVALKKAGFLKEDKP